MQGRRGGGHDAAMRRTLLLLVLLLAFPAAAEASVIPTVSAGTLTVTGDGAADSITLRLTSPSTVDVNGVPFARGTFSKIEITDPELDRLHVDTKPGNDALTVTGTTNQLIGFTFSQ